MSALVGKCKYWKMKKAIRKGGGRNVGLEGIEAMNEDAELGK